MPKTSGTVSSPRTLVKLLSSHDVLRPIDMTFIMTISMAAWTAQHHVRATGRQKGIVPVVCSVRSICDLTENARDDLTASWMITARSMMSSMTFYFVAERTLTVDALSRKELLQVRPKLSSCGPMDLTANYKGWTHWHTDRPDKHLMESTNFCAFTAPA